MHYSKDTLRFLTTIILGFQDFPENRTRSKSSALVYVKTGLNIKL